MAHRKYPWEDWFGRPCTILVRGIHYHCSQSTMAQTIRNNACKRRLRVRVKDRGTEIEIEVLGESKVNKPASRAVAEKAG